MEDNRIIKDENTTWTPVAQNAVKKSMPIWVNIFLFGLTVLTTMMVGANLRGVTWQSIVLQFSEITTGWQYSFAILLILTSHEFGHYFAARYHKIKVTLPFYIPLPIPDMFHFGTMGAFIRIKSPVPNRNALMDVAIAGPLAGFVLSFLALSYGYVTLPDLSTILSQTTEIHNKLGIPPEMIQNGPTLTLGKSVLFYFFQDILGKGILPMNEAYHYPFIFAGWIGLLITAINLIPIGQLDGGHIFYALLGARAKKISLLAYGALGLLTVILFLSHGGNGFVWVPWMVILFIFIGFRHPPTLYDDIRLTPQRRLLGWICIVIFFISFMPLPISIN